MVLNNNPDERGKRGQVGIGTLIVFIAMVLVAAIAAGVLINTADLLQTQAEDTGEGSQEQVSDSINAITEVGIVNESGDHLNEIRVGVQPTAGANDINLEELTVQYISDNDYGELTFAGKVDNVDIDDPDTDAFDEGEIDEGDTVYDIDVIIAESEDDYIMTDSGDGYQIVMKLNETGELGELEEGEELQLTVTTDAGAQKVITMQVPESLAGDDEGDTVSL